MDHADFYSDPNFIGNSNTVWRKAKHGKLRKLLIEPKSLQLCHLYMSKTICFTNFLQPQCNCNWGIQLFYNRTKFVKGDMCIGPLYLYFPLLSQWPGFRELLLRHGKAAITAIIFVVLFCWVVLIFGSKTSNFCFV